MTERLAEVVRQVEEAVLAAAVHEPGADARVAALRTLLPIRLAGGGPVDDDATTNLRYLATMLAHLREHELGIQLLHDGAARASSPVNRARLGALHGVLLAQLGQTAEAALRFEEALADAAGEAAEAARIHSALAVLSADSGATESSLLLLGNAETLTAITPETAFAHAFTRLRHALLREDAGTAAALTETLAGAADDLLDTLPDHHPDALAAVADLAYARFRTAHLSGRPAQLPGPAAVLRAATLALTAALGAENPRTITARLRQAECDRLAGVPGDSDVREETSRLFGPDHPLTVSALAVSAPAVSAPATSAAGTPLVTGPHLGGGLFEAVASAASPAVPATANNPGPSPPGDRLRSAAGSVAVGPPGAGRSTSEHSAAKPDETGVEVAARVLGTHHPLTVVLTAAAHPEGDDLARAAARAALVLGVGHSVTRMLDERLRSCRRTGPTTTPTHRTTDAIGTDTTAMSEPTAAATAATATASTHTAADLHPTADGGSAPPDTSGAATPAASAETPAAATDAAGPPAAPSEPAPIAAASATTGDSPAEPAASGAEPAAPAVEPAPSEAEPTAPSAEAATAPGDGTSPGAAEAADSPDATAPAGPDDGSTDGAAEGSAAPTAEPEGSAGTTGEAEGSADSPARPAGVAEDGADGSAAGPEPAGAAEPPSDAPAAGEAGAAAAAGASGGHATPGRGRGARQPESEEKARIWDAIEKIRDDGGVIRGRVVEVVKGGLVLDVGVRAFLPASLVEMRRVRDLNPYVGRELEAKVLEMDRGRGNLVLSRRAHLEETRSAGRSTLLAQLAPGQIRRGVISSVVNFGAFVDLGGVDGLISVAELSWTHHNHPSDVVEVGQEVEVEVLDVDQARGRISLSLKATQQDPWPQFARNHPIGQIVSGRVTKLMPFGAFIRVDGLEGLVHVSELADHRVDTPDQVLRTGQDVLAKVTDIDLQRRRISLSIRQANAEYLPDEEQFDPVTYGMVNTYDAEGNYIYPEGFDAGTGEWLPGFEEQRDAWERQYAEARDRWVALGQQVEAAQSGGPAYSAGPPSGPRGGGRRGGNDRSASHGSGHSNAPRTTTPETTGNEDIDERLAALRERLSDGRNSNRNDG